MGRLTIIAGVLLAAACSGGPGTIVSAPVDTTESPGKGDREKPGVDREPAGGDREAPPASQDKPTGGGDDKGGGGAKDAGGGTTGGENCPKCDTKYTCNGTLNNAAVQGIDYELKTKDGACVVDGVSPVEIVACGGSITLGGQSIASWTAKDDTFTVRGSGTQLNCQLK